MNHFVRGRTLTSIAVPEFLVRRVCPFSSAPICRSFSSSTRVMQGPISRPNHTVEEEDQVGDERKSLLTAIKEVRSHNNSPAYEIADSRNRL
jgi:hypothetical protein